MSATKRQPELKFNQPMIDFIDILYTHIEQQMGQRRAWSFLTIEGERKYKVSEGYYDDPKTTSRYDNFVANLRQVSTEGMAVIRSADRVIGIAELTDMIVGEVTKERGSCPVKTG